MLCSFSGVLWSIAALLRLTNANALGCLVGRPGTLMHKGIGYFGAAQKSFHCDGGGAQSAKIFGRIVSADRISMGKSDEQLLRLSMAGSGSCAYGRHGC